MVGGDPRVVSRGDWVYSSALVVHCGVIASLVGVVSDRLDAAVGEVDEVLAAGLVAVPSF